uniref:Uncharacterized protein n=1 Tax=Cyanistes caeruleus TaxID=156563 RepID=A0A8C0TWK9_CYACU
LLSPPVAGVSLGVTPSFPHPNGTGFGGGASRGWLWGLTVSPCPAYRTVCGVNGPLVVLDNVKVRPSGDTGDTALSPGAVWGPQC